MTKSELVSVLVSEVDIPHNMAETVVNICFKSIVESLYRDDRTEIRGLGIFCNRNYKAYQGRNPKTGEKIIIKPKKVPFFKAGKELKELINT